MLLVTLGTRGLDHQLLKPASPKLDQTEPSKTLGAVNLNGTYFGGNANRTSLMKETLDQPGLKTLNMVVMSTKGPQIDSFLQTYWTLLLEINAICAK